MAIRPALVYPAVLLFLHLCSVYLKLMMLTTNTSTTHVEEPPLPLQAYLSLLDVFSSVSPETSNTRCPLPSTTLLYTKERLPTATESAPNALYEGQRHFDERPPNAFGMDLFDIETGFVPDLIQGEHGSLISPVEVHGSMGVSPSTFTQPQAMGYSYQDDTSPRSPHAASAPEGSANTHAHSHDKASQYHYRRETSLSPHPADGTAGGSSTDASHGYRRLPSVDQDTVDKHLEPCHVAERGAYKCLWPNCLKEPFKIKHKAHLHVHKHLGSNKLYECITCNTKFASRETAKRHQDTQNKTFPCKTCLTQFARRDYRNFHEKRCKKRKSE